MDIKENQMQSYFKACDVFGVDAYNKIDIEEIRTRYRNFAKIYHPDINKSKDAVDKMVKINKAFTFFKNNVDDLDDFTYYANYYKENGETPNNKESNKANLDEKLDYGFIGWSNFLLTIIVVIMLTCLLVNGIFNYEYKYLITMVAFGAFLFFYYIMMFLQGSIYKSALFFVINIIAVGSLTIYSFLLLGGKV